MRSWIQKYKFSILISSVLVFIGAVVFMIVAHPPIHVKSSTAVGIAILIHIVGISLELFIVVNIVNFFASKFKRQSK